MLTLTHTAAEAVKNIVASTPDAADGGVRIRETDPAAGFELSIAKEPQPEDTVVVTEGARVFLDGGATQALEDRVLDAEMGQDGSVRFALAAQG